MHSTSFTAAFPAPVISALPRISPSTFRFSPSFARTRASPATHLSLFALLVHSVFIDPRTAPPFLSTLLFQFDMLNRLPPELVRQIIESAIPSTYYCSTYDDRQALLQSLCLVCHLFRDIAQPLLLEIVYILRQRELKALLTTLKLKSLNGVARQAVVRDLYLQPLGVGHLDRILRSSQGLRSLTLKLKHGGLSDLSGLQDLPRKSFLWTSHRVPFTLN